MIKKHLGLNKINVKKRKTNFAVYGFSLLEVSVTLAIFGIILAATYSLYPSTRELTEFNFVAQEFVSKIKNAQSYGASSGGVYKGAGFFVANLDVNTIEFLDVSKSISSLGVAEGNKYYDDANSPYPDSITKKSEIRGSLVSDICFKNLSDITLTCSAPLISATYARPNAKAYLTNGSEATPGVKNFYDIGYIELKSKKLTGGNAYRCIEVYKSGQISLKSVRCRAVLNNDI